MVLEGCCCVVQVSKLDSAIARLSPEFTNEELDLFKKLVQSPLFVLSIFIYCKLSPFFSVNHFVRALEAEKQLAEDQETAYILNHYAAQ